jgi:hypothetical protein
MIIALIQNVSTLTYDCFQILNIVIPSSISWTTSGQPANLFSVLGLGIRQEKNLLRILIGAVSKLRTYLRGTRTCLDSVDLAPGTHNPAVVGCNDSYEINALVDD